MAGSRRWDGVDDWIQFDVPAPFTTGAATLLAVCRPETITGDDFALLSFDQGLPEYGYSVGGRYTYWYTGSSDAGTSATAPLPGVWTVQAASKGAGSVRPRFHRVRLDGGGPATHEDASGRADDVVPAAPLWVGNNVLEDYTFPGEIAAWACWGRALSDEEIEQCVTWEAIQALRPDLSCRLDGEPPFDGQLAIVGTAHSDDEPPDFWGAGPTVWLYDGTRLVRCTVRDSAGSPVGLAVAT